MRKSKICCLCGHLYTGYGSSAWPVKEGVCCDVCNRGKVIPARIKRVNKSKNKRSI